MVRELSGRGVVSKEDLELIKKLLPNIRNDEETSTEVLTRLSRLESTNPGLENLNSLQRLQLAIEVCNSPSVNHVADKHNLHRLVVARTVRDTVAATIHFYHLEENVSSEVSHRVAVLNQIDETLIRASEVRHHPSMVTNLRQTPHSRELIDIYLQKHTVKNELDALDISYNHDQLRSIERYLLSPDIKSSLSGLSSLSQRYVLAKWLHSDYDDGDTLISNAAVYILSSDYSHLSEKVKRRIQNLKTSLRELVVQDYQDMGKRDLMSKEDLEYFPLDSNQKLDVVGTYQRFGQNNICPLILKKIAQRAVDNLPQNQKTTIIKPGKFYSQEWLDSINWSILKFLENTLAGSRRHLSWEILTQDTGTILKNAKQEVIDSGFFR